MHTLPKSLPLALVLPLATLVVSACGGGASDTTAGGVSANGIPPAYCASTVPATLKGIVTSVEQSNGVTVAFTLQGQRSQSLIETVNERIVLGAGVVQTSDGKPATLASGDAVTLTNVPSADCKSSTLKVVLADQALRDLNGVVTAVDTNAHRFTLTPAGGGDISVALTDAVAYVNSRAEALQVGKTVAVQANYNRQTNSYTAGTVTFQEVGATGVCTTLFIQGATGVVTAVEPIVGPATSFVLQNNVTSLFDTPPASSYSMTFPVSSKVVAADGSAATITVGTKVSVQGLSCGPGSVPNLTQNIVVTPVSEAAPKTSVGL